MGGSAGTIPRMAKLAADFEYTDENLLGLWREADAKLAAGAEEWMVLGQKFRRSDADQITAKIKYYQDLVNRAGRGAAVSYARFKRKP